MDKKIQDREKIDFSAILRRYKKYWWLFLCSIIVCLGVSYVYLQIKSPRYLVKTLVMFNQNYGIESDGAIAGMGMMSSPLSLFGAGGAMVEDEIRKIGSHTNMITAIKQLKLNRNYWSKDWLLSRKIWYFEDTPITIDIPDAVLDTIGVTTKFSIDVPEDGKDISLKIKQEDLGTVVDVIIDKFPYIAKTPYGVFHIDTTSYFVKGSELNFRAVVMNNNVVVEDLNERMAISQLSKKTNAVQVDIEDVNIKRGEKFLDTLIALYNERDIELESEKALSLVQIIDERLLNLREELNVVENKLENYKSENQIVDAVAEAEYTYVKKERIETSIVHLETKFEILQMIKDFLASPSNKYNMIPFTGNLPNEQIKSYNNLVLQYITLEASAKKNNVALKNLQAKIDVMRENVIATIDKSLQSTQISLGDMRKEYSSSEKRVGDIPRMERELKVFYRQQKIKNEIYTYLLREREQMILKLNREAFKGEVVDKAYAEIKPVSPKKIMIIAFGMIVGFLIPMVLLKYLDFDKQGKVQIKIKE